MDGVDVSALLGSTVSGWDLLLAVFSVVIAWILSIFVRKGVRALLRRVPGFGAAAIELAARIAGYLMILLGIGIGLSFLGASVQPLLAIAIIVGVILVLVLRGVADNFAAGVVLQSRHPLKVGDEIEVEGHTGTVLELNGRTVVLRTADGRTVHMPNALVTQNPLVNHSEAGARRGEVEVRVAGEVDASALAELLTAAAAETPGVHRREQPRTLIVSVSPARTTATVQFWHHPQRGVATTSDVVLALTEALRAHSYEMLVTSGRLPREGMPIDGRPGNGSGQAEGSTA